MPVAPRAPRRRRLLPALLALTVLAVAGDVIAERGGASAIIYAPNFGHPPALAGDPPPPAINPPGAARSLRVEVGPPGASLALWILDPPAPRATVFVLHGIRDQKSSMLGWGRRLVSEGYRAVLVDGRGHGRSSGDFLTYGVAEARDLSQVLDALESQRLLAGRAGVMGVSYGAATAIEWAGAEPRVAAVVAVAPFASLRAVVPIYTRHFLPVVGRLIPGLVLDRAIARAGREGGFDPDAASPLEAIARTRAPVLLIHGREDTHIPAAQSAAMHARAPDHSELVILDDEDHGSIFADRTGVLWQRASAWFARALDPK
jgi:pimeloyl-ACP methyl ester carboxylesterase